MQTKFQAHIDDLLNEITRREPTYCGRFGISLPDTGHAIAAYRDHPLVATLSEGEIAAALGSGAEHLRACGIDLTIGEHDPLGAMMSAGMIDSFAAERGLAPLESISAAASPIVESLSSDYEEKQAKGLRYFMRRSGDHPLVVINACGIPLSLWSRFLGDRDHSFRIIVVERRGQNVVEGGIHEYRDLASDATDIMAVLEQERLSSVDVLAWCDGGKLAIELVRTNPDYFRRLVLLSVSMRGTRALTQPQTAYESNFEKVITTIAERPNIAPMFAKMLGEQVIATDWEGLAHDVEARAAALLRLPAHEHQSAIRVPMSREHFLVNHARRIFSDASYPVDEAIRALDLPYLLITGDHDHIANNTIACAALARTPKKGVHAQILGAGHYCFDLQYPYLKLLIDAFLVGETRPQSTARLRVEEL